eukprot:GHVN01020008.1.p2 GENE.GHVN01020008.1~~GHVN01020008.1.p2  ORF type:complete len:141 (+),score=14.79 GHVN01020008.1:1524-1946(+)
MGWTMQVLHQKVGGDGIQRRCIGLIDCYKTLSYSDKLQLLRLQTMQERHDQYVLTLTSRLVHHISPLNSPWALGIMSHPHQVRHVDNLTLQLKFALGFNFFTCSAPHLWNKLPLEIREAESSEAFKRQLVKHQMELRLNQ